MIPPEEAWSRIECEIEPLETTTASRRQAVDMVLAEPLGATEDVPAHDVSAMDGFAVAGAPATDDLVEVTGTIAAGDAPGVRLQQGTALRIMTGAPVPEAADRIIPVELSRSEGESVRFSRAGSAGDHIRRRGEIVARGQQILAAGSLLTPGALALLATHGYGEVKVLRRPSIAVLATGDEVVPPEKQPQPGQLRDSHTDFLLSACRKLGSGVDSLGIASDRPESLRAHVESGLDRDVLLVCGGVSMGEFDFVEAVFEQLGCRVLFDSVAIQPGKPLVVARREGGWVFGLPGNPASVMVGFWLFVRPLLRRLQGLADGYWQGSLTGELTDSLPGAKDRDRFFSAEVRFEAGRALVRPRPPRGSHDLAAYGQGTALVRVPAGSSESGPGAGCRFLPLIDWPMPRASEDRASAS